MEIKKDHIKLMLLHVHHSTLPTHISETSQRSFFFSFIDSSTFTKYVSERKHGVQYIFITSNEKMLKNEIDIKIIIFKHITVYR